MHEHYAGAGRAAPGRARRVWHGPPLANYLFQLKTPQLKTGRFKFFLLLFLFLLLFILQERFRLARELVVTGVSATFSPFYPFYPF